jgi:hypothetical protein
MISRVGVLAVSTAPEFRVVALIGRLGQGQWQVIRANSADREAVIMAVWRAGREVPSYN